jgi:ornithine cyclodeaminase/alanine dehydrogenase-like protein (mu-crystallin family)
MAEVPAETVAAAKVVVDHRASCLAEAGDLVQPIRNHLFEEAHIHAEIGEIASGQKSGRESESEITFFKSVGNAVQDLAVAGRVYEIALEKDLGSNVRL